MKSSSEAYRRIHECLGLWIECALEAGFLDDPLGQSYAADLIKMAEMMREIESHTDI